MRLAELQRGFMTSLLSPAPTPAAASSAGAPPAPAQLPIRGGAFSAAERLNIYRNNLRENFCRALALEFPVIERLVGADFFRQTALEYLAAHPSRSGDLQHVGDRFAEFLAQRFGDGDYAYFADVATLERIVQLAMIAADATLPFDAAGLAALAPARLPDVFLGVHPAARLLRSRFPVVSIWNLNQRGAAEASIDLTQGGENALVLRPLRSTLVESLGDAQAAFLEALVTGGSLGSAVDAAFASDPDLDIATTLQQFVARRVFVSWRVA